MVLLRPIQITLISACSCLAPAVALAAGWFHFDPMTLEAEIRMDGNRTANDLGTQSEGWLLRESLIYQQTGYIWDPRINTFSVSLAPIFRQERRTVREETESGRGNDLNYSVELGFLEQARGPVAGSISSYRLTNVNDAPFAVRNETDITRHELQMRWRNPYFPVRFLYTRGSFFQVFEDTGAGSRPWRDEDRERYELSASSSKLKLNLFSEDVEDNASSRDYIQNRGTIAHAFSWGRGSSLDSRIIYRDRSGFNAFQQLNWIESARITHTQDVNSDTQYTFYSQKAEDPETFSSTRSERHNARFRLEHSLYNNLFSFGRLRALQNNSELVDQTEYEAGAGATYSKTFFSELDLSVNVQADYRYTDRQTEDGLEDVINEPHTASFVEPIILGQALVQQETIRVTSQDGFTYMEGFDYEVIDLGQLFTEIRILPGGQISLGERLLVSYKYVPFPSAEFNTLNSGYGLSLGYRWLHFFHSESQSTNKLESGAIPPPDRHDRTTGFELSFLHDKFEVRARAESRYREIGGSETRSYQMSQSLFLPGKGKFNFSFSGSQVFTESRGSVFLDPRIDEDFLNQMRDSDYYAFDARLNWFPRRNLRISPRLGYWSRKEKTTTNVVIETDREYLFGGLDVSWYLRQLLVEFSYQRNTSSSNTAGDISEDIDTVDDRVMLTIRRQFR